MLTEKINPRTRDFDQLSTLEAVTRINAEDMMVAQVVQHALPHIAAAIDAMIENMRQGGRVIYVGAGTSGRLGLLDAVECVPTFGVRHELFQTVMAGGHAAFMQAVEGAEDSAENGKRDLLALNLSATDIVIGIAASGRTPYVMGAIKHAVSQNMLTVGISCNSPAPLLEAVRYPIAAPVGPEVISGSTRMKAGTAQKMILNMISTVTMTQLGKVYQNLMVDVVVTNQKLYRRARDILVYLTGLNTSEAEILLKQANNHVKTALVMHFRQVEADTAKTLLTQHQGILRDILDEV
jgi:N-acetylmuramic acid 6-phosphate etherase